MRSSRNMKLSAYLNEERNINSEVATIKKLVKSYIKDRKDLTAKLYDEIGSKTIKMAKNLTENEMEDYMYSLKNWLDTKTINSEPDIVSDIETIINAVIEKYY